MEKKQAIKLISNTFNAKFDENQFSLFIKKSITPSIASIQNLVNPIILKISIKTNEEIPTQRPFY